MGVPIIWMIPLAVSLALGASRLGAWSSVAGPALVIVIAIVGADEEGIVIAYGILGFVATFAIWALARGGRQLLETSTAANSKTRASDPRAR